MTNRGPSGGGSNAPIQLGLLHPCLLLEANEIIFLQDFLFTGHLEARRFDLSDEDLLPGSHMAQHPFAAFAFDAIKVDQDDLPAGSKGFMDRLHGSLRKLEMVISVADENQIDRVLG